MGNCDSTKVRKIHQDECLGLDKKPLTSTRTFTIEMQIISGERKKKVSKNFFQNLEIIYTE